MAFKRAQWHSGLTYRQVCETCGFEMVYKDNILDFRPWYADGFVYCSRCKTPLRHREAFAIDAPAPETQNDPAPVASSEAAETTEVRFCSQCGKATRPGDVFCSGCGSKLH